MMTQDEKKENAVENDAAQTEETVGALLRRTRLAKKQDLRDIASYLCIRYQFLQALEENRYRELPGEAYANGFIRTYASYLGLDAADILERYKREFFAQEREEKRVLGIEEEEAENITPAPKVLLVSLILLLAAYGFWQAFSVEEEVVAVPAAEQGDSVTIVEQSYPAADAVQPEAVEKAAEEVVPPVPPVKPVYDESAEKPAEAEKKAEEAKPAEIKTIRVYGQKNRNARLVLVANEEVWVEVTRGENVLFARLMNKGDRYQVSAHNPEELFLKTGNAGGLDIYCDGNLTQPLGPRGALRANVPLIPADFAAKVIQMNE